MHHYQATAGTVFNFNGDFSGEVVIRPQGGVVALVPAADLWAFMAEIVRRKRMAELERTTDDAILGASLDESKPF